MMKFKTILGLGLASLLVSLPAFAAHQVVHFDTTLGGIDIELFNEEAPITVKNFLEYIDSGFFNQTIFHRVIPGFVAQGGGLTADMQEKETKAPIKNEAGNGLSNLRGTLSMARTNEVDSATSEFFINFVDNVRLDHKDNTPEHFGYAVFGKVISGMDIVDQMAKAPTHSVGEYDDVPVTPIVVLTAARKK